MLQYGDDLVYDLDVNIDQVGVRTIVETMVKICQLRSEVDVTSERENWKNKADILEQCLGQLTANTQEGEHNGKDKRGKDVYGKTRLRTRNK